MTVRTFWKKSINKNTAHLSSKADPNYTGVKNSMIHLFPLISAGTLTDEFLNMVIRLKYTNTKPYCVTFISGTFRYNFMLAWIKVWPTKRVALDFFKLKIRYTKY